MKKRITAFLLSAGVLLSQSLGTLTAFAEGGKNLYGHSIAYSPVTQLYAGGEALRLFDAGLTEWWRLDDETMRNEAKSVSWLQRNNYLLNRFGRRTNGDLPGCMNSKGEWLTQIKGPTNVRRWSATVRFNSLVEKEGTESRANGNISNIYEKGDLQYFFSWKVKTVQTKWGLRDKSNDIGYTFILDESVTSKGGGWKKYHTFGDGPNFGDFSAWKNGKELTNISFIAQSDKDAHVDSYLSGAMLVGRDAMGPKIDSVRVTSDLEGKSEFPNGTVTLDEVDKLKNRTIYFQVQWDEPVVFNNLSAAALEKLTLKIDTIGVDGTSGMLAEAPFLKFAPSKKDGKPVMVFEYKIPDPYTDGSAVTQERGYYYKFSKVSVSEKENTELWNNIYDISGNKFAADSNGRQPSGRVIAPVSGSACIDLMPFGIKSIKLTKTPNENSAFIRTGDLIGITLTLNKPLNAKAYKPDLPKIQLNIKNSAGEYVTVSSESFRPAANLEPVSIDSSKTSITYYTVPYYGYSMDDTSLKVTSVLSDSSLVKDASGYSLMDYELNSGGMLAPKSIHPAAKDKIDRYTVSPDRQYKLDFTPPSVDIKAEDAGEGTVLITAMTDDVSTEGCEAVFTVKLNGSVASDELRYQAAASERYNDSEWQNAAKGAANISFSAPIITAGRDGRAYGFVKLPDKSEADKIDVSVTVADEAGNSATAEKSFTSPEWNGYDKLAPVVTASVNQEKINVSVSDLDDEVEYSYGFSENDTDEPSYTSESGKSGTITAPALPGEGEIYSRVVWIRATDSSGNTSDAVKVPMKYDRTYTKLSITADTEKEYLPGDYPSVYFEVDNAKQFYYMWIEKPAGVSDIAAYIHDNYLADIKSRAEEISNLVSLPDDDPDTEQSNNHTNRISEVASYTPVVSVNPKDESLGESIDASETSRPIVLVIAVEKDDGSTLVRTVEFDTFYAAPGITVHQNRFSTNNQNGERVDYIRDDENTGLLWAGDMGDTGDYRLALNTPNLFGFAQAEFYLDADPITKLDRIDLENSTITLEKVLTEYSGYGDGTSTSHAVAEWKLSDMSFSKLWGDPYNAIIDIDIKDITPNYYEIGDDGTYYSVRYDFVCNMKYTLPDISPRSEKIAYFAFNNTPGAYVYSTYRPSWGVDLSEYHSFDRYPRQNTEAVLDSGGNDVTQDIPVYTVPTEYEERQYLVFAAPGVGKCSDIDNLYYGAPVLNTVDPGNKEKLVVHIGTKPDDLSEVLPFTKDNYITVSEPFYIGDRLTGDADKLAEVTLYYRFELPERGIKTPVYVLKLRRDNVAPVFDISVSETEETTNEVLVKLNALYDAQTAADGTTVIDTPEHRLTENMSRYNGMYIMQAWRYAGENEDLSSIPPDMINRDGGYYDEETGEYVSRVEIMVLPDENGFYHFTTNGYFIPDAFDDAGHRSRTVYINGKAVDVMSGGMDWPQYYINNIDNEPPKFESAPVFTVNEADGSFTITAKTDSTATNAYLRFDAAYEKAVLGSETENSRYSIENVPGLLSGGFNKETGEINAGIYAKYSENTPLSSVTLIVADKAGNEREYEYTFTAPLSGKKAEITNARNAGGYPVCSYGEALSFTVPVKLDGMGEKYSRTHSDFGIYADGITEISFTDLFGEGYTENIYMDFGAAFAHSLVFSADGREITPQTPVSGDVTVRIDTGKTKNLTVDGGNGEYIMHENGTLKYSLTNTELSETKSFSVPVTNIDRAAPEALVSISTESETDPETGVCCIYSVTYSVEGFSEQGVELIAAEDDAAAANVTFDFDSAEKMYTFRFRDAAGNEGTYTADASDITFTQRKDSKIEGYRLTYSVADDNGFRTIGRFGAGDVIDIGLVNRAVSVRTEALNKNGESVSAVLSADGNLPQGTKVYAPEKLVMFTDESREDRTVNLTLTGIGGANSIKVPVRLPANSIDMTAPTGTVHYSVDGDKVKARLVTNDTDLRENGVSVVGTKSNGEALVLKSDENGYYTEFDLNGAGRFVMTDKAGNVGTVAIAVLTIDKEPPQILAEGWQGYADARTREEIAELLATPTNNTIKLFITFNEQLRGVEVKAFASDTAANELLPTDEYVTAATSGNALTVEFKQNCQAKLTVYDLHNNAYTVWRPEDGPITVIDRDVPKPENGYPKETFENNTVKLEYIFANGEEVMLLQNHGDGYKNRHEITFSENGQKLLSFADRAGNVFSDYPFISKIDDLAPGMKISLDFVGEGKVLSAEDGYKAGNMYTNKNVRVLMNVTDATQDGIAVTAETKAGIPIEVKTENITANEKPYNYYFTVTENGSYRITVKDKWGNENIVEAGVSVIDRTAPTIVCGSSPVTVKTGTDEKTACEIILKDITATDLQSGANAPLGNKVKDVNDGVKINVDLSGVKLSEEGTYSAKITAADRLGNTAEKLCRVIVADEFYTFAVGGTRLYANDVFTTSKNKISLDSASGTAKYYYMQGYKTAAQMKYAKPFDAEKGFDAPQKGYYTILAQESSRKMYLLYVYVANQETGV